MGENDKKKDEKVTKTEKDKKIGIKIPRWIGYPFIILLALLLIFYVYYAIKINRSVETSATTNIELSIECPTTEIKLGEKIEITINNFDESITLESTNQDIIKTEGNCIIGNSKGEATVYALRGEEKSNEIEIKCVVPIEQIKLDKEILNVTLQGEETLTATILPEDASDQELIWESEDTSIATVEQGVIKGIKEGKTNIIVYNKDKTKSVTCEIIVKKIEVQKISLDESDVKLGEGQNYILRATTTPNVTNEKINWVSSDENVVKVSNGNITAIASGTATVSAVSTNGKKASCTFNVSTTKPSNKIRYASESFNVRTGPGVNYSLIGSVSRNEEIEILKEESNWTKLRLGNGKVGYTISKAYSSDKAYRIDGVPYINQFNLGYPTGCEAVSATMAAKYSGYNVSVATIVANTPTDELGKRKETITTTKEVEKEILNEETGEMEKTTVTETETEIAWVGGNPFEVFVGHPSKGLAKGSYGCFAAPIATALNSSGVPCSNISGCSVSKLYDYIKQGKPVVVWCKKNAGDLVEGVTWKYPDGSGEYKELIGEHCAVMIGFDGDYVYLNDPSAGKDVRQPKWKFESNWQKLFSQAIVIN